MRLGAASRTETPQPVCTGCPERLDRTTWHRFQGLAVQLAENARRVDGECQGAGERSKPQGDDEDQSPQDVRHGTEYVEYETGHVVRNGSQKSFSGRGPHGWRRFRADGGERHGHECADQGAEE